MKKHFKNHFQSLLYSCSLCLVHKIVFKTSERFPQEFTIESTWVALSSDLGCINTFTSSWVRSLSFIFPIGSDPSHPDIREYSTPISLYFIYFYSFLYETMMTGYLSLLNNKKKFEACPSIIGAPASIPCSPPVTFLNGLHF